MYTGQRLFKRISGKQNHTFSGKIPFLNFDRYQPVSYTHLDVYKRQRIMYPEIRITVPTPTIGPKNVEYSLNAGANKDVYKRQK